VIPVAIQDRTSRISIRAIHPSTGSETTLASATLVIYSEGGSVVLSSTAATLSGSEAYYETTWPNGTYALGRYRVEWTLADAVDSWVDDSYFEVVLKRFRRPIGESDFTARYPYLASLIPSGSSMAGYLDSAWDEIGNLLYARLGQYPGNVFYPEQLGTCLEFLTISTIHRAIMMAPGTEDELKSTEYRELAMDALDTAMSFMRANTDEDRNPDDDEWGSFSTGVLVR